MGKHSVKPKWPRRLLTVSAISVLGASTVNAFSTTDTTTTNSENVAQAPTVATTTPTSTPTPQTTESLTALQVEPDPYEDYEGPKDKDGNPVGTDPVSPEDTGQDAVSSELDATGPPSSVGPDTSPPLVAPEEPTQDATESPLPRSVLPLAPVEPPPARVPVAPRVEPDLPATDACSTAPLSGLQTRAAQATRDIMNATGFAGTIYGRRGNAIDSNGHPAGLAADFMVGVRGVSLGNAIRDYALENKARLGVTYVIWQQRYYGPGAPSSGRFMDDRGSVTANHYDHVHVNFARNPGSVFDANC